LPITQETIRELTNLKTNFELRHLKIGDFAWVARHDNGEELLLPYIVERKRLDDLEESILDGRYDEQKVHELLPLEICFFSL
jgi:crossover junction endonuclease MUS81